MKRRELRCVELLLFGEKLPHWLDGLVHHLIRVEQMRFFCIDRVCFFCFHLIENDCKLRETLFVGMLFEFYCLSDLQRNGGRVEKLIDLLSRRGNVFSRLRRINDVHGEHERVEVGMLLGFDRIEIDFTANSSRSEGKWV